MEKSPFATFDKHLENLGPEDAALVVIVEHKPRELVSALRDAGKRIKDSRRTIEASALAMKDVVDTELVVPLGSESKLLEIENQRFTHLKLDRIEAMANKDLAHDDVSKGLHILGVQDKLSEEIQQRTYKKIKRSAAIGALVFGGLFFSSTTVTKQDVNPKQSIIQSMEDPGTLIMGAVGLASGSIMGLEASYISANSTRRVRKQAKQILKNKGFTLEKEA